MKRQALVRLLLSLAFVPCMTACNFGASTASDAPMAAAAPRANNPESAATPRNTVMPAGPGAVEQAVANTLRSHYPAGYDEANRCWRTTRGEGDDAAAYCMRPLPEHAIQDNGSTWIYLALASASDIREQPDYLYGQVDAGMMDAFKLRVGSDGTAEVVAKGLGLAFGSAGDCGCANAVFVQVGSRAHGWMFTSGGTWQGTTVASHALVAPVGDTFKDVVALPRFVEGDQSIEQRVAILPPAADSDADAEWYPLRLSRWRAGTQMDEARLEFDAASSRYTAAVEP